MLRGAREIDEGGRSRAGRAAFVTLAIVGVCARPGRLQTRSNKTGAIAAPILQSHPCCTLSGPLLRQFLDQCKLALKCARQRVFLSGAGGSASCRMRKARCAGAATLSTSKATAGACRSPRLGMPRRQYLPTIAATRPEACGIFARRDPFVPCSPFHLSP